MKMLGDEGKIPDFLSVEFLRAGIERPVAIKCNIQFKDLLPDEKT